MAFRSRNDDRRDDRNSTPDRRSDSRPQDRGRGGDRAGNERQSNMAMITGLWENTAKSGITYLRGNMGYANILIFENRKKERDQDPDYYLFVAPKEEREEEEIPEDLRGRGRRDDDRRPQDRGGYRDSGGDQGLE